MSPDEFQALFDVPHGTVDRLRRYAGLLTEWQGRMNLVAPSTLCDIWGRHFADSAQLAWLTPPGLGWLDFGAGAGFPGMVLAAMDHGRFELVDSIAKKCRFLEAVAGELGISHLVTVTCARVERLSPRRVAVVTARATAALGTLFGWSVGHGRADSQWIFPKGRNWAAEVAEARKSFQFDLEVVESLTDSEARLLRVRGLRRKAA